jgi:methyl-accepting chemotaxis protein
MNRLYNLRLTPKLILAFLGVSLMTALLGAFAIVQLSRVNERTSTITNSWLPASTSAGGLKAVTALFRINEARHILAKDEAAMDSYEK